MTPDLPEEWATLLRLAQTEVAATLAALPVELRQPAVRLPVLYESVPSAERIDDGIEPETLGLFSGDPIHDKGASLLPACITLFLANLWEFAEYDLGVFREEVRVTYLHELGHYLDLDEDDLEQRGLL